VKCPIPHPALVQYWAHDLSDEETQALEEHLFSCDDCFEAAGKIAALATGLRDALPPVALEADLERARAQGVVMDSNDFHAGDTKEAWMRRGINVLIHRLVLDERQVPERVSVEFETLDGTPLFAYPDAPVDPKSGVVLIACQRHFIALTPELDMRITVRGKTETGSQTSSSYTVLHRFE